MKIFLQKLLILALLTASLLAVCEAASRSWFAGNPGQESFLKKFEALESMPPESVKVAVFGNSHMKHAWDSASSAVPSFVFADQSQDLYFDREIFNKYQRRMTGLQTVVLSLSYFSFGYKLEAVDKDRLVSYRKLGLGASSPLSDLEARMMARSYFLRYRSLFAQQAASRILPLNLKSGGPTKELWEKGIEAVPEDQKIRSSVSRIRTHFTDGYRSSFEIDNQKILFNFISDILKSGRRVILVTPPLSLHYQQDLPAEARSKFLRQLHEVLGMVRKSGGPDIPHLDLGIGSDYQDNYFRDPDHLNVLGAERFTRQLGEVIKTRARASDGRP